MAKLTLSEIEQLDNEIRQLFSNEIPFPLKFRIETKLLGDIEKAIIMIDQKRQQLALENGARKNGNGYSFDLDEDGKIKESQKESFDKFAKDMTAYILDTSNEVEIDVTFKLSMLKDLKDSSRYKVFSKFIIDDLD